MWWNGIITIIIRQCCIVDWRGELNFEAWIRVVKKHNNVTLVIALIGEGYFNFELRGLNATERSKRNRVTIVAATHDWWSVERDRNAVRIRGH